MIALERRLPLLSSGFRPFFLAGALYGPALVAAWYGARAGWWDASGGAGAPALLHAHELIFGFSCAIVCGLLLTALPSWSGARDLRGAPLAALVALWLAGRVAFLGAAHLPPAAVAVVDCALLPAMGVMLARTLAGARLRLFVWTLPPLAGLAAANAGYHVALADGSIDAMRRANALAVHSLAFLYSLYGGLLAPAFTRSFLRARGEPAAAILVPLEYATAVAMVLFAATDLLGAPPRWIAAAALGAAALHVLRFARWRGWRTGSEPLLWTLHAGYAWLIVAFVLRAAAALTGDALPRDAWLHAFTIGALGMTMSGLMTRVALRHTGRVLRAGRAMRAAYAAVTVAALARLAYSLGAFGEWAVAASALLWAAAFLIFALRHGPMLLAPSLPRGAS